MNIAKSNSRVHLPVPPPEWRTKLEARARRRKRALTKTAVMLLVLGTGAFSYWMLSLPGTPEVTPPPLILQPEVDAMISALKPKRARPVIAVIGLNEGTETTDYLLPYGILKRANVAEVLALATRPGRVQLDPALTVEPDATTAEFDLKYPDGADYVIVPAMSQSDAPVVLDWLRAQSKKGAAVVGVCAGATIVANAGLLDGKRATTHWYFLKDMLEKHPSIQYVRDRRFVVHEGVMTTTGISASMPMSLTLIEAIAGREKAIAVAGELGLTHWDAWHASGEYAFTRPFVWKVLTNKAMFWKHETLGLELKGGVDEVSVALVADALSRTYRSRVETYASDSAALVTKSGLRIVPDSARKGWVSGTQLEPFWERPPPLALEAAMAEVGKRYGMKTRKIVATQLEMPN
ncbi:MAG: DJ-1/PfpI family protein [Steroidobacteraceae bacterium]|nr:DJ-1/PfpI family protein [Steroidobacteraceae bacterium]